MTTIDEFIAGRIQLAESPTIFALIAILHVAGTGDENREAIGRAERRADFDGGSLVPTGP